MLFCTQQIDGSARLFAPSADRNKQPILEILLKYVPQTPIKVLEVSSGTGQHVCHFAPSFPKAIFQPSEIDPNQIHSINAYLDELKPPNIRVPLVLDISKSLDHVYLPEDYGPGEVDVIININMIHVSSNAAVDGLFESAGELLKIGSGRLFAYGAFAHNGQITPPSNVDFDAKIRAQNPEWGLRDINDLREKAKANGLELIAIEEMPANNKLLVFERRIL